MVLYITNRQENILAYEAYFLAFRVPFDPVNLIV